MSYAERRESLRIGQEWSCVDNGELPYEDIVLATVSEDIAMDICSWIVVAEIHNPREMIKDVDVDSGQLARGLV